MEMVFREWQDHELIMISAIQHYSYCPRQCALIHVEQTFDENLYTMRGRLVHEHVDQVEWGFEEGIRVERALPIWSSRLGIIGKADLVEFRDGIPYPVEYKHGSRQQKYHDDLQLCAQAVCLEEMTGRLVSNGAIYYYSSRRRREVAFDDRLRLRVEEIILALRDLLKKDTLPLPVNDKRCRNCSLLESCLPEVIASNRRLKGLEHDLFRVDEY